MDEVIYVTKSKSMGVNWCPSLATVQPALLSLMTLLGLPAICSSQTSSVNPTLYSFSIYTNDGYAPYQGVTRGNDGNYYGTTYDGGVNDGGVVFRITPAGVETQLHYFDCYDSCQPIAGLALGSDGNFYGTTTNGNVGSAVFRISPNGVYSNLHYLADSDGQLPIGAMVQGTNGFMYGTTTSGGSGDGGAFKISTTGVFSVVTDFTLFDNAGALVEGSDGNFYGAAMNGGANGLGTIFQLTPSGVVTVLHNFASNEGDSPNAPLAFGSDGLLYGTTLDDSGTGGGYGSVFKITTQGQFTLLDVLGASDEMLALGPLMLAPDGQLYGTSLVGSLPQGGSAFRVESNGTVTVLYEFGSNTNDGNTPRGPLVAGTDGKLYGLTSAGGANYGGTVFGISVPGMPQGSGPSGLSAVPLNGSALLQWNAVSGATSYNVYAGSTQGGEATSPVASGIQSPTATISGLTNGQIKYFKVSSVTASAESAKSGEVSVTPTAPPSAVSGLTISSGNQILNLSWTPISGAITYSVLWGTSASALTQRVDYILSASYSFYDTSIPIGTVIYFQVLARNIEGYGPGSSVISAPIVQVYAPTPVISPNGGSYRGSQTVTITDSASAAEIFYTTDGTTPGLSSLKYTQPISVSTTETINAVAYINSDALSIPAVATFTIKAKRGR